MLKKLLLFTAIFVVSNSFATHKDSISNSWKDQMIEIRNLNDSVDVSYIDNTFLFSERWDTLAQPVFWRSVMTLSPDSCVINIAKTRTIVKKMSLKDWDKLTDSEKDNFRDSIRLANNLGSDDKIYMTTGKNDFYAFEKVLPSVAKGVEAFSNEGVDPWYAQAILMIESPGKLAKSNVGAYGPFQLMPSVARSHGLKVNKYVDERQDFVKSAQGASSLISKTCIPEAKSILNKHNISYNEHDLWFRLFVLHVYHAGAYNVASVVNKIAPSSGGNLLIQEMWQTSSGKFRNASQNYTQLAIAAMLILDELVWERCDYLVSNK
ncbi:MAG: transglycosylase SLT domain-containing protein [Brumimicrobium sp.]